MWIKSLFLRFTAALVTAVMLLGVGVCDHAAYDVEDPDTCRLHFSVLSDVHVEGNNFPRYKVFARALQDVRRNKSGNDAVLFLGDSTMNGHFFENLLFHGAVDSLLRRETVLTVQGNHDIGNGEGDYDVLNRRWLTFTNAFFGRRLEHPYYAQQIRGCSFIVLATETQTVHGLYISDAQYSWLEDELQTAAQSGMPAFVFCHFPTDYAEDINGRGTDRLMHILAAYAAEHDLFCFVGHTHMPLYLFWSFHTEDGYPETYLPRLTELYGADDREIGTNTGVGVEVELYDDELLVRGRNFYRGEWRVELPEDTLCEVRYPLHASK